MKPTKAILLPIIAVAAFSAVIAIRRGQTRPTNPMPPQPEVASAVPPSDSSPRAEVPRAEPLAPRPAPVAAERAVAVSPAEKLAATTNKLERLTQIREMFHTLAAGDHAAAMRAAKQITNEVERETALLTLVTEWTQGDLRSPRLRAHLIDVYGVETALGVELAKDPELAMLWANELTEGPGRAAVVQQIARLMVGSDPASALALNEQLPESDRRQFFTALFSDWAFKDTSAALQWADQFPDPADRETIVQAIRTTAPVGIGAELAAKDGYTLITKLVPGMPAELGGQLRAGDRLLSIAQGDGVFVDARGLPLEEVTRRIRGAPGTMVQLQVLAADAPPNSPPRTVSILRDQIKFKR